MADYYSEKLSADRLLRCYEIASPRVQHYLEAEIEQVRAYLHPGMALLELGCGYGRVLTCLADSGARLVGIDISPPNVALAKERNPGNQFTFHVMDALALSFTDASFDLTICIQNGICAFRVDEDRLLAEAIRVTKPGGRVILSTYAARFWEHRLAWFERQAEEGLIGPLDRARTRSGRIVCTDGFESGTRTPEELSQLAQRHGLTPLLFEVDDSSLFMVLPIPDAHTEGASSEAVCTRSLGPCSY